MRENGGTRGGLAHHLQAIPLTEGIGCGGAVGTTVGRRSRARYGRTLHVTFATARSGRAAAGEFRYRTNEAVVLFCLVRVCLFVDHARVLVLMLFLIVLMIFFGVVNFG